jgi:hypothetical protein
VCSVEDWKREGEEEDPKKEKKKASSELWMETSANF